MLGAKEVPSMVELAIQVFAIVGIIASFVMFGMGVLWLIFALLGKTNTSVEPTIWDRFHQ